MPNIGKTIRTHNRKVTEGHTDEPKAHQTRYVSLW